MQSFASIVWRVSLYIRNVASGLLLLSWVKMTRLHTFPSAVLSPFSDYVQHHSDCSSRFRTQTVSHSLQRGWWILPRTWYVSHVKCFSCWEEPTRGFNSCDLWHRVSPTHMGGLIMTDTYENYLYFNINQLNGRRDLPRSFQKTRFTRFLSFLESFDSIDVNY